MTELDLTTLPDPPGPTVEQHSTWRPANSWGRWEVKRMLDVDGELYVELEEADRSAWDHDPEKRAVPLLTLLREYRKDGHEYPTTVTCKECGVQATGTESMFEREGWWLYGMGSGPLCPTHAS